MDSMDEWVLRSVTYQGSSYVDADGVHVCVVDPLWLGEAEETVG